MLRIRRSELTDWLTDWLTDSLINWLTDWLTGSVVKRLWVRFPSSSTKPRFLFCVVPVYYYNHPQFPEVVVPVFYFYIIRLKLPEQQPRRIRLPTQEETDFQTPDVPVLHMTVWSWWNLKVVELTSYCTVLTWCQLDNFVVSWILTVIKKFLNSDLVIWSNF